MILNKFALTGGSHGSGMISLLEEVERLQEADRILEYAGMGQDPFPSIEERDLTE